MNRCMRIMCMVEDGKDGIHTFVQQYAQKFLLEGLIQPVNATHVRVIVCGQREAIENFIDALHHGVVEKMIRGIEMEPIFKDRDYRGVFRVIE
ncbi:MAG: acylphosphatase [Candidatus Babeliales bacterium]|jgi:acylphosphatase